MSDLTLEKTNSGKDRFQKTNAGKDKFQKTNFNVKRQISKGKFVFCGICLLEICVLIGKTNVSFKRHIRFFKGQIRLYKRHICVYPIKTNFKRQISCVERQILKRQILKRQIPCVERQILKRQI